MNNQDYRKSWIKDLIAYVIVIIAIFILGDTL
jgi:hypothetical protein